MLILQVNTHHEYGKSHPEETVKTTKNYEISEEMTVKELEAFIKKVTNKQTLGNTYFQRDFQILVTEKYMTVEEYYKSLDIQD